MESNQFKASGIYLIVGCFFMIVTMVLHPVGGDFNHLLSIVPIGRVSHAIAILSLPFVAYGFWGLTDKLGGNSLDRLSFLFMLFGLVAVMLAAAVNGLILMDFVARHEGATQQTIDSLKPFFRLISSFNHAFDFIFIGAVCISTTLWSVSILRTTAFPSVLGWLGLVISAIAIASLIVGYVFVDLHGFRMFIFGWVIWVISIGASLIRR